MKELLNQLAQGINAGDVGVPVVDESTLLLNILNTIYFVAGLVAVIVVILAGFSFVTSGGDLGEKGNSGKVAKAKKQILYAVIGIVVILVAFTITNFIIGSF